MDLINSLSPPLKASSSDALKNILNLEKRVVLGVIAKMGLELTQEEKDKILRVPTKNFQAFMAYCVGLELEDAGQYDKAAASFEKAVGLDPTFEAAGQKADECQSVASTGSEKEAVLASVERTESPVVSSVSAVEMFNDRLQNISNSIGSSFIPSTDSRKTTADAASSGADVGAGNLPDPPRPPGQ
jgi:tetratricopeptide (TPR) repeat protein